MRTPGTEGYDAVADRFFATVEAIDFAKIHACLLPFLPANGRRVLDLGTGSGRDAAALARLGYTVTAVEPLREFLERARSLHANQPIRWHCDALPELASLHDEVGTFDFVLCHGVWQHLDDTERATAMRRVADLLSPDGVFALGLRHGAAGAGTRYFEATLDETDTLAEAAGLRRELGLRDQPSAIPGKPVTWTRCVYRKGLR